MGNRMNFSGDVRCEKVMTAERIPMMLDSMNCMAAPPAWFPPG
jgi:hypothetical protein